MSFFGALLQPPRRCPLTLHRQYTLAQSQTSLDFYISPVSNPQISCILFHGLGGFVISHYGSFHSRTRCALDRNHLPVCYRGDSLVAIGPPPDLCAPLGNPPEPTTMRGSGHAATADAGAWLGCPETRRVAGAGSTLPVPCPGCMLEGTAGPCGTAQLLLLGLG